MIFPCPLNLARSKFAVVIFRGSFNKVIGEFLLINLDSKRNCQSKVLYPGTDITIHRLARQWGNGNALPDFVGMKCFSLHTFVASPTPIDSTFCYAYTLVGTLEGPRLVTADPEGSSNCFFLYIGLYTVSGCSTTFQSEEGQTPSSLPRIGHSRPWGSPSVPPLYRCMYHPGGRFSLANRVKECIYVNKEKVLYYLNNTKTINMHW